MNSRYVLARVFERIGLLKSGLIMSLISYIYIDYELNIISFWFIIKKKIDI